MGWWLSVFMFINGAWIPGSEADVDGWAAREYETKEICETRRDFTMRSLEQAASTGRHITPTHWVCNEGSPLTIVPADLPSPEAE